jgi:phosphoglycerate-specific signal transduction histidine kinase
MIVTAILLTWGVVALALFLLSTAREVVNDVIRDDVPRVIDTARLSATTADLGLLSNRLLRANEADLDAVEEELRNTVAQTQIFFDSNISRDLEPQLLSLLEANFDAVVLRLNTSAQIDKEIARQADALRWLYIDIEDEASALVADFRVQCHYTFTADCD